MHATHAKLHTPTKAHATSHNQSFKFKYLWHSIVCTFKLIPFACLAVPLCVCVASRLSLLSSDISSRSSIKREKNGKKRGGKKNNKNNKNTKKKTKKNN